MPKASEAKTKALAKLAKTPPPPGAALELAQGVLEQQAKWTFTPTERAEIDPPIWLRWLRLAEVVKAGGGGGAPPKGSDPQLENLIRAAGTLQQTGQDFDAWASTVDPRWQEAFKVLMAGRHVTKVSDLAKVLLEEAARAYFRTEDQRAVRDILTSEKTADAAAPMVADILRSEPTARWIKFDKARNTAEGLEDHPGSSRGIQIFDVRERGPWQDAVGKISGDSVRATMLGHPVYDPRLRRPRG
jgi:hypothetical protein